MKKIAALVFFANCLLPVAYCQLKVTKALSQKIIAGMGGVFMAYTIEYKDKKNAVVVIDSVKSIADASLMTFYTNKSEAGNNGITFRFPLLPPAKCKTCVETTPPQPNLTKGVIIYYKRGEKRSKCKVKKFRELEDQVEP